MQKKWKILGIDLGGCMSGNSAYIYAEVEDKKIDIIEAIKEPKHKEHHSCQAFIVDLFERFEIDAIAIDAPLSLPAPLLHPTDKTTPREGSGEIINPYLFRYTDYFIFKQFGLRPMPPAGDRIGRLTARAVALLHHFNYNFPNITVHTKEIPIYEVYPKQIAQSLGLEKYKKSPDKTLSCFGLSQAMDEHLIDAILCVYGGGKIMDGDAISPPKEAINEGWCFPIT